MLKKILVISSVCLLTACGGSSGSSSSNSDSGSSDSGSSGSNSRGACSQIESTNFNCSTMLVDLVEQGVRPLVSNFKTQLVKLNTDTVDYCADINQVNTLTTAKNAWLSVMETVQQLQAMEFGPSDNPDTGLRSFYAWEEASPLNIDLAIAANTQSNAGLPGINNRKELTAIEYILFSPGAITNTASQNLDMQNWITVTNGNNTDIQNDRCDYAKLVTANLANKATDFETSWNAYTLSTEANSKQAAANEVSDALFFADKQIKDAKVKAALPQASSENFDASKLESKFANVSKEHLINNLVGLKRIFIANDTGHGLDDYLAAAGQEDVAIEMIEQMDAAIANLERIEGTLNNAVNAGISFESCSSLANNDSVSFMPLSDIDELCKFQFTIKQLTDTLKDDYIIATKFTTPASASGDND